MHSKDSYSAVNSLHINIIGFSYTIEIYDISC